MALVRQAIYLDLVCFQNNEAPLYASLRHYPQQQRRAVERRRNWGRQSNPQGHIFCDCNFHRQGMIDSPLLRRPTVREVHVANPCYPY
jgi:hypothetical protein